MLLVNAALWQAFSIAAPGLSTADLFLQQILAHWIWRLAAAEKRRRRRACWAKSA